MNTSRAGSGARCGCRQNERYFDGSANDTGTIANSNTDTNGRYWPDGGNGDGTDLNLDPLLIALLKKIPPTEDGWPGPKRARWFKMFAMNVSQIYDANEDDPVEISIKLEGGSETGNG